MELNLTIKTKSGKVIKLYEDEAKELYNKLKEMYETMVNIPYFPFWEIPSVPYYQKSPGLTHEYITTAGNTTSEN